MTDHSPLPWHADEEGKLRTAETWTGATPGLHRGVPIASPWQEGAYDSEPLAVANAKFIVRAVNAHDALVAALTEARDHIDGVTGARNRPGSDSAEVVANCDAALALALPTAPPAP